MILIAECIVLCIIFTLIILPAQYKDPSRRAWQAKGTRLGYGLGNIVLYESNGIYWFMLEAGNYYDDGMFIRDDVRFENIEDINHLVDEMLNYMVK